MSVGKHSIAELFDCNLELVNNAKFIKKTMKEAALRANSTLLKIIHHEFDPQGITMLGLLSESHISIHTWPEMGYVAVDAFTCGEHCDPEKAVQWFIERLESKNFSMKSIPRGELINSEVLV